MNLSEHGVTPGSGAVVWRGRIVDPRKLELVRVPNLTGRWRGYLLFSFDGHQERHNLIISIWQTWTQMSVFLTTETSISCSCAAVIQIDDPEGLSLTYQYQNQPLANAMRTMHMHCGTAVLRLSNNNDLSGDYSDLTSGRLAELLLEGAEGGQPAAPSRSLMEYSPQRGRGPIRFGAVGFQFPEYGISAQGDGGLHARNLH